MTFKQKLEVIMASSSDATETPSDSTFDNFISEVKAIEKRDSVLTPKMQIDRLLRPGSTYFNLNPFEVLQVEPNMKIEDVKKKYRKLSILVHPDKNVDDKDRAQTAFEAVSKAMRTLEDEAERKKCLDIIEEAKMKAQHELEAKKKELKKNNKPSEVPEDDPEKFKEFLYKTTVKLFADYEIRRRDLEQKEANIRKRERETEIAEEEKVKKQKEWQKEWEAGRDKRVNSWRDFKQSKKKKSKSGMGFKPPKPKLEER